jgi:hypothetical protein
MGCVNSKAVMQTDGVQVRNAFLQNSTVRFRPQEYADLLVVNVFQDENVLPLHVLLRRTCHLVSLDVPGTMHNTFFIVCLYPRFKDVGTGVILLHAVKRFTT